MKVSERNDGKKSNGKLPYIKIRTVGKRDRRVISRFPANLITAAVRNGRHGERKTCHTRQLSIRRLTYSSLTKTAMSALADGDSYGKLH